MAEIAPFIPRLPKAQRDLARYLRDQADLIESDMSATEPVAAIIVLTGPAQHEVLHVGNAAESGFIRGALAAASAVCNAPFTTLGGNFRPRTHGYGGGPDRGDVVSIARATPTGRANDGRLRR